MRFFCRHPYLRLDDSICVDRHPYLRRDDSTKVLRCYIVYVLTDTPSSVATMVQRCCAVM